MNQTRWGGGETGWISIELQTRLFVLTCSVMVYSRSRHGPATHQAQIEDSIACIIKTQRVSPCLRKVTQLAGFQSLEVPQPTYTQPSSLNLRPHHTPPPPSLPPLPSAFSTTPPHPPLRPRRAPPSPPPPA